MMIRSLGEALLVCHSAEAWTARQGRWLSGVLLGMTGLVALLFVGGFLFPGGGLATGRPISILVTVALLGAYGLNRRGAVKPAVVLLIATYGSGVLLALYFAGLPQPGALVTPFLLLPLIPFAAIFLNWRVGGILMLLQMGHAAWYYPAAPLPALVQARASFPVPVASLALTGPVIIAMVGLASWVSYRMLSDWIADLETVVAQRTAHLAALAQENARLYTAAQDELAARRQAESVQAVQAAELAALHTTALGLLEQHDLNAMLDSILLHASRLVGDADGYITLLDDTGEGMVARAGTGQFAAALGERGREPQGVVGEVWKSGQPLVVNDYANWPHKLHYVADIAASIGLPLKIAGRVIGVLGLGRMIPGSQFTQTEADLLARFAVLASLTVAHAQLLTAAHSELAERRLAETLLATRNAQLAALYESALALLEHSDLDPVLDTILAHAVQPAGDAEGFVSLVNAEEDAMIVRVVTPAYATLRGRRVPLNAGALGQVWATGAPLVVNDYPHWPQHLPEFRAFQAVIACPLLVRERVVGVLSVARLTPGAAFQPDEVELLRGLAPLAALALDHARLLTVARTAQAAAEAANQAKNTFFASLSHEFRTPLTIILGYSALMAEDEAAERPDAGREMYAARIHEAGSHLLALINTLLDLAKIEAGKFTLQPEIFAIPELVNTMAVSVRPLMEKNGNQLQLTCAPDLGEMCSDLTKVRQILFNLLSNAAKFTRTGTVSLMVQVAGRSVHPSPPTRNTEDWLEFVVHDTGIGMTTAQMDRLFREFEQGDATISQQYGGTGLGLALSQRLAHLLGGAITVTSQPAHGSTFTLYLPRNLAGSEPVLSLADDEVS